MAARGLKVRLILCGLSAAGVTAGCKGAAPAPRAPFTLVADSMGEERMPAAARRPENLAKAHDGVAATRWTTGAPIAAGFFIQVVLPRVENVTGVSWDAGPAWRDYPRSVRIETSPDGDVWEETTAADARVTLGPLSRVKFRPPRRARYVMITALEPEPYWWSVYEMEVVLNPPPR